MTSEAWFETIGRMHLRRLAGLITKTLQLADGRGIRDPIQMDRVFSYYRSEFSVKGGGDLNRLSILNRLDDLNEKHCKSCTKMSGRYVDAQKHCREVCQIGQEIQRLGGQLMQITNTKRENKPRRNVAMAIVEEKGFKPYVEPEKQQKKKGPAPKDAPDCGLTKEIYIEQIAAGETNASLERAWGMKVTGLYPWINKWGLKGLNQDKAQKLLDAKGAPLKAEVREVRGLNALNEQIKQEDNPIGSMPVDAWPSGFDVELFERKDAEIADLRNRLKRAIDRIETMTETTNDTLDRNTALKQERDDYKRAATDLESKIDLQADQQGVIDRLRSEVAKLQDLLRAPSTDAGEVERLKEELANSIGQRNVFLRDLESANQLVDELASDRQVLLATLEEATKAEKVVAPTHKRAGRSLHTELDAPTEQIVDELAALISYIRSSNGQAFYLDLQLNEVTA